MDLFQSMRAFVTTVKAGSMTAAAVQLDLTPAMVGQHIAALESRFGTKLLNRTTRRQNLTEFGASYLEQCKDILERVALADMEAESQLSEPRGTLRITAPVTFGSSLLMPALARYRTLAPLVKIDVVLTDRNVDLIDEGFDLAFRIGHVPDSRLIQRKLMPYKMVLCAAPDYLASHKEPVHPSELSDHELVAFTSAARASLRLYNGETMVEVAPRCSVTVNSGHALLNAARACLGIIIQPEILLEAEIKAGNLVRLLPDWQLGERQVSLLYYRDQHMTPRSRSFINFALDEFEKGTRGASPVS